MFVFFFFQAEDGIRDIGVTGVQTCALPISSPAEADVQEVDLSDEWATILEESRHNEAAVEAPAPVSAKPVAGPKRHTEPGEVEEFQIGEESPIVSPDDVPAGCAVAVAPDAPAGPRQTWSGASEISIMTSSSRA